VRVDDRPDGRSGARFVVSLPIVLAEELLDDSEGEWLDQVAPASGHDDTEAGATSIAGAPAVESVSFDEVDVEPAPVYGHHEGPSAR
jgi:hypothetical protein